MEAIFSGSEIDEEGKSESVVNILARFRDIEDVFPEGLTGKALPYFSDWLIQNVYLVEITAYSDADAYTIFETMNDRGMSLTSTEMLKSYLLANIDDSERRSKTNDVWRDRVASLQRLGKETHANAIAAWLRSQYAKTIRERRRHAQPRDFDLIGTEFHRWVRDHATDLSLTNQSEFGRFIEDDFDFYGRWYERIRQYADNLKDGMESIYFNSRNNFTLQYPVLLAPLKREDSEKEILCKLRIVAFYIDILIARRIWNGKSTAYSTMQYAMYRVILDIRGQKLDALAKLLFGMLRAEGLTFGDNGFRLHGRNGRQIHRLLARMTDYVGVHSGQPSKFIEYTDWRISDPFQIEHIWSNHPERHTKEFVHPNDFSEHRNRVGGLLLLPRSFNAAFGDSPYQEKYGPYFGQNLLAQSLNEQAYTKNPGFRRFREQSGLPFKPYTEFTRSDLDERQELYRRLAEQIWDPEILLREATEIAR